MSSEWEQVRELHRAGKATFRFSGNMQQKGEFWGRNSKAGCFLESLSVLAFGFTIFAFFKWGWLTGLVCVVAFFLYWRFIDWLAKMYAYRRILTDPFAFEQLYESRVFCLVIKGPSERFVIYPEDWREAVGAIAAARKMGK